jgi:hypothetical protein
MGHPDRKQQRQKKKAKQEPLDRKTTFNTLDLTPHNAVGKMNDDGYEIKLK